MKTTSIALYLLCMTLFFACNGNSGSNKENADSTQQAAVTFNNSVDSVSYALGIGWSGSEKELKMVMTNAGIDTIYLEKFIQGIKDGISGENQEFLAYQMGYESGYNLRTNTIKDAETDLFGENESQHLNINNFIAGFMDVVKDTPKFKVNGKLLAREDAGKYVHGVIERTSIENMKKEFPKEFKANNDFMAAKAKEPGIQKLDEGILYKVITPGKGPKPSTGNLVSIEYEGHLIDGTMIIASNAITDVAVANGTINFPGFTILMTSMPLGSEWEAYIPWSLSFGPHGYSDLIPPFSNIILKVKLHNIKVNKK